VEDSSLNDRSRFEQNLAVSTKRGRRGLLEWIRLDLETSSGRGRRRPGDEAELSDGTTVLDKAALAYGQMNKPPGARARAGLAALTAAEYFRDEEGNDVFLFIENIFRFTRAGSEVSRASSSTRGFKEVLAGKHGDLSEQAFYMVGGIEDAAARTSKRSFRGPRSPSEVESGAIG
jgi:F0F1-type ATP synthase beta subunit